MNIKLAQTRFDLLALEIKSFYLQSFFLLLGMSPICHISLGWVYWGTHDAPFIMCYLSQLVVGSIVSCTMLSQVGDLRSFLWAIPPSPPNPPFGLHRHSLPFICQLGIDHCILKNGVHEILTSVVCTVDPHYMNMVSGY